MSLCMRVEINNYYHTVLQNQENGFEEILAAYPYFYKHDCIQSLLMAISADFKVLRLFLYKKCG